MSSIVHPVASPQWVSPITTPSGDNSSWELGGAAATNAWSTVNTETNWYEVVASTNEPWAAFELALRFYTGGAASRALVDLAIGAGGSERVLIPNILIGSTTGYAYSYVRLVVPIPVPRGSRLAMRWQGTPAFPATERPVLSTRIVGLRAAAGLPRCARATTVLTADATSRGTAITGGYAFSGSAWVELIASCPFDVRHAIIVNQGALPGTTRIIQLGRGTAPNIHVTWAGEMGVLDGTPLHVSWPRGSQIHRKHFFAPDVDVALILFG